MHRPMWTGKRGFDVGLSALLLLSFFPVIAVCALLITISSKGPVLYGSTRVGLRGKQITCWKLRTMYHDAEAMLQKVLQDPTLQDEWTKTHKLKKDPRITPIGHFLRKTSLDELPQLWNVLKGDLSLVGPRPISFQEVDRFLQKEGGQVFTTKPGLTGLWQTSGRSNLPYEKRIELEKQYLQRQSFLFDLFLLIKTIPSMLFPKGAF